MDVERNRLPMVVRMASSRAGTAMDERFSGQRGFTLVFVRVHFRGAGATADLAIDLDSIAGEEWDTRLYVARQRGPGADLNLVFGADETSDPSPWAFQAGDALRFTWANPGGVSWGLEVGYQPL